MDQVISNSPEFNDPKEVQRILDILHEEAEVKVDPATRLAEALNIPRTTAKVHLFRFIYGADAAKYDIDEVVDRMIEQYRSNKEQE